MCTSPTQTVEAAITVEHALRAAGFYPVYSRRGFNCVIAGHRARVEFDPYAACRTNRLSDSGAEPASRMRCGRRCRCGAPVIPVYPAS